MKIKNKIVNKKQVDVAEQLRKEKIKYYAYCYYYYY